METTARIRSEARSWVVPLARLGYAAKGVVYVLIGAISALAAFEAGGGDTTGSRPAAKAVQEPAEKGAEKVKEKKPKASEPAVPGKKGSAHQLEFIS